jgi:hypothetical protein
MPMSREIPYLEATYRVRVVSKRAIRAILGVLIAVSVGLPADAGARPAGTRVVALVSVNPRISPATLRSTAAVLQQQANEDLRAWWPGPRVRIEIEPASTVGTHPWELVIAKMPPLRVPGQDFLIGGAHAIASNGEVVGTVFPTHGRLWTELASHELLEMLEDPSGGRSRDGYMFEICDRVENAGYYLHGVLVSDFVTPAWFSGHGHGPFDYLGLLKRARSQL